MESLCTKQNSLHVEVSGLRPERQSDLSSGWKKPQMRVGTRMFE